MNLVEVTSQRPESILISGQVVVKTGYKELGAHNCNLVIKEKIRAKEMWIYLV